MFEKIKKFRRKLFRRHKLLFVIFVIFFDGLLGWGVDKLLFVGLLGWEQTFTFLGWCGIGAIDALLECWSMHSRRLDKNKSC